MVRRRAVQFERVHDDVERHVRIVEGIHVDGPDLRQVCGERCVPIDDGPQGQSVDEHADEQIERSVPSSGHRCSDDDVVRAAVPGQKQGEARVQGDERRGVVIGGKYNELLMRGSADSDVDSGSAHGRVECARTVRRQVELLGRSRQLLLPERDL